MMAFGPEDIEPFIKFEKDGWEGKANAYHDRWGMLSAQSSIAMLKAARVGPGSRVLDVATGAGYVAAAAADMGAMPTGLDFARAQVELARQVHPEVEFRQGDAQDLPFESGTFDAVVMGFGMNHLPDPQKAALEARRVLTSGGAFAFTVWAPPSPGEGFGVVLSAIEEHGVPDPKLPAAPPYFRFADSSVLRWVGMNRRERPIPAVRGASRCCAALLRSRRSFTVQHFDLGEFGNADGVAIRLLPSSTESTNRAKNAKLARE